MSTPSSWADGLPTRVSDWPIERQCLIHLLRVALGMELRVELKAQCSTIRVPRLMQEIQRHRVGAYLAHRLPPDIVGFFPPRLGAGLKRIAGQTQLNALRQTAGLARLAGMFAKEGLSVMSLKGPLLAQELHGNQGVRHAGDIDFSIRKADVLRADALLRENGFRRTHPAGDMSPHKWKRYAEVWRDCEYNNSQEKLSVEVMWRLANINALQAQAEVDPAVEHVAAGVTIRALPREVHVVYLLVHGANHGWFRLFWLVDIAILMRAEATNWKRMHDLAVASGVERHYWQGLCLARDILGAPWPEGLMDAPTTRELAKNIEDAYWQLELSLEEFKFGASHYRKAKYARRLMPDLGMQWREMSKRWISPDNWQHMPLSDRWFALYYVVWPVLWAWRQVAKRLWPKGPPAASTD